MADAIRPVRRMQSGRVAQTPYAPRDRDKRCGPSCRIAIDRKASGSNGCKCSGCKIACTAARMVRVSHRVARSKTHDAATECRPDCGARLTGRTDPRPRHARHPRHVRRRRFQAGDSCRAASRTASTAEPPDAAPSAEASEPDAAASAPARACSAAAATMSWAARPDAAAVVAAGPDAAPTEPAPARAWEPQQPRASSPEPWLARSCAPISSPSLLFSSLPSSRSASWRRLSPGRACATLPPFSPSCPVSPSSLSWP